MSVAPSLVVVVLVAVLQGLLEWLPVSSEGGVALVLAAVAGMSPTAAVRLSLFLHAGTGLAAAVYYRAEWLAALRAAPGWRPAAAFAADRATLSFLAVATLVSGVVGAAGFLALETVVSSVTGGGFLALVGGLLVVTGVVQRAADRRGDGFGSRERPDLADALLVGAGQGLAVLPGVSRSGTTASALLLRGHDGESALGLSFLLSVPAAVGAGVLAVAAGGGLPSVAPAPAALALAVSAVVGYATVDALMRLVRRVAFWAVCVGFGGLAVVGGLLVAL